MVWDVGVWCSDVQCSSACTHVCVHVCVRAARMEVHHHHLDLKTGKRCICDICGVALSLYIEVIVEALLEG